MLAQLKKTVGKRKVLLSKVNLVLGTLNNAKKLFALKTTNCFPELFISPVTSGIRIVKTFPYLDLALQ